MQLHCFSDQLKNRTGNHAIQNTNFPKPFIYTVRVDFNLLELNPRYPKNPRTLGEKMRKARMDKGLLIRELAAQLGVTEDTVINWEIRGLTPHKRHLRAIKSFLEL